MGSLEETVTGVIINFQTPDLTRRAIESLKQFYPRLPLLLADNGSKDSSRAMLQEFRARFPATTQLLLNARNVYHGPAMHQVMQVVSTSFVFFLDSDCEVRMNGFMERMLEIANKDPLCYAIGKKVYMNQRGFDVPERPGAFPYIRPICMIVRKDIYGQLRPFRHHGTPCLENMRDAIAAGYRLTDFPIFDYISHEGRGTASRYGYGLGIAGKLNYLLNKMGL